MIAPIRVHILPLLLALSTGCAGTGPADAGNASPVNTPGKSRAPAFPGGTLAKQPDGRAFQVFLRGDERRHWHETTEGYSIVYNTNNRTWYYARCQDDRLVATIKVGETLPRDWPKHLRPGLPACGNAEP